MAGGMVALSVWGLVLALGSQSVGGNQPSVPGRPALEQSGLEEEEWVCKVSWHVVCQGGEDTAAPWDKRETGQASGTGTDRTSACAKAQENAGDELYVAKAECSVVDEEKVGPCVCTTNQ